MNAEFTNPFSQVICSRPLTRVRDCGRDTCVATVVELETSRPTRIAGISRSEDIVLQCVNSCSAPDSTEAPSRQSIASQDVLQP